MCLLDPSALESVIGPFALEGNIKNDTVLELAGTDLLFMLLIKKHILVDFSFLTQCWSTERVKRWEGKAAEGIICLSLNLGCQARSIFGEEEKTTWEVAIDKFNNYMTDLNTRTDQMMEGIMSSQISRELEWVTGLTESSLMLFLADLW